MEILNDKISGVCFVDGECKNIIINYNNFNDSNVTELIYLTDFNEVESLFGFEDLKIIEVPINSTEVTKAGDLITDTDNNIVGVVFLENSGYLMITNLMFFSGYTIIKGKQNPYLTLVESDTYEDCDAANLIEEEPRLQ